MSIKNFIFGGQRFENRQKNINEINAIPGDALEALARCLYPIIFAYYNSEEGQRAFAEWQTQQDTNKTAQTSGNNSCDVA